MRRFYLLAAIASFASISGCYWDSELYDTFVADDGNVEHCPGMASIRYYTDKKYDTDSNNQTDFIKCDSAPDTKPDDITCEKDGVKVRYDSGKWKPVNPSSDTPSSDKPDKNQTDLIKDLTGKHASMALSFEHKICPKNFFCKTEDKEAYCTNKEIIVQEVVCGEGTKKCGDACYDTKTDTNHCGECGNDCLKLDLSPNASTYKCESGKCVPVCKKGYHLVTETLSNNENNFTCAPDTPDNCSQLNCTTLAGWDAGECNEGDCVVTKCKPSFYLASDGTCKTHTREHCGQENAKCQEGEKCIYDSEKEEASCLKKTCEELGAYTCPNGDCKTKSDETNCGDDCTNCTSIANALDFSCKEGKCVFKCLQGYHQNAKGDACEIDSPEACGSFDKACQPHQICNKGECECDSQYADCDENGSCETNLEEYGLVSCNQCMAGYTACGKKLNAEGAPISLCLNLNLNSTQFNIQSIPAFACAALCNYDDWKINDSSNPCTVDKYICCVDNNNDKNRWHTKVSNCSIDTPLCTNNSKVAFTYLDKGTLEKKLTQPISVINNQQLPNGAKFYTYRVNNCSYKNTCQINIKLKNGNLDRNETVTTNDKGKEKTFYPLVVECQ